MLGDNTSSSFVAVRGQFDVIRFVEPLYCYQKHTPYADFGKLVGIGEIWIGFNIGFSEFRHFFDARRFHKLHAEFF